MLTMPARSFALKTAPKDFIGQLELFKNLPAAALADIKTRLIEKKFRRNESLFEEGDEARYVWFVKEGHVKAVHHNSDGRCQTLCMTSAQCMFGSCCSFGQTTYPCTAMAETDTTVVALPIGDFSALLSKHPQVGVSLVQALSNRLRESKDKQTVEQEPVEARIIHTLLSLIQQFGKTIPLTRREIAEMSGTTVETSIRTFLRFESEGLVSTSRGKISIKDIEVLKARLENR